VNKLPTPAKIGLIGAGLLIIVLVGWFAVISPKRAEASKLGKEIEETHAKIIAAQASAHPHAPTIRVADLFELSRAMPDRVDIPSVLLQLSAIATETGVTFQSITPHDPLPLGSYEQIGISLVFEGHFYDLSDFLYRLRNLVNVHQGALEATGRLFTVDSVSFDEGELQFPQVKATLGVSAYVFGNGTAPPLPVAATGATPTTTLAAEIGSKPIPPVPPNASAARAGAGT
jgi:Tfp pilus assembly protein PilO